MLLENKFKKTNLTIGLLGGSFNPPHLGHVHISESVRKLLNLDYVWWLLSPQNPLKDSKETLPIAARIALANYIIKNPQTIVSTIEKNFNSCYTVNTIKQLKLRFPNVKFVWIMGADNLLQFSKWYKWREIFGLLPIAVYDRDPFSYRALRSKASISYSKYRVTGKNLSKLAFQTSPVWGYLRLRKHPLSSTEIRKNEISKEIINNNDKGELCKK
jgi:nicotinate-nucleotide adenylyltransferase